MKETATIIPETASDSLDVQTAQLAEIHVLSDDEILNVAGGPEVDVETGG
ncbi:hypothetical protein [Undibacterium pigrum]|uniref:Uncharacterized protein n=1 Tax=Undibacterium pigrum TaxID=401470 RepID=A0A318JCJ6_9BURK|nr:hypothetical protein [Undibacterium pigrum]PXX45326.1 hypothetical protein DFR42_102554 [Undibacterium pigrum]